MVTLRHSADSAPLTVRTDEFGDFWVDGLEKGAYAVTIEKDGYAKIEMSAVTVDKDLNLGDLAMRQEPR